MLGRFIGFKSSSPLCTPNHPTAPPGTPEHPDHPEHTGYPHHSYHPHCDDPSHPLSHPLIPQIQHQKVDSDSDTHLPQPNTRAADPGPTTTTTTRSVLTSPFHLSLVLENRGSVARDHLALERTYLAYVRTSLAIASAGVALVQLFTTGIHFSGSQFARPLGAVMVVYGLVVLTMGTFRYFRIQHTLPRGLFATSLHGIAGCALILGTIMTVVFGILVGAKT